MNAKRNANMLSRPTGSFATRSSLLSIGGSGAPSRGLFPVLICAAALLVLAPPAMAKQARLYAGTFGAASNPAPFPANPYPLAAPESIAVDSSSHDVYVIDNLGGDGFGRRVEKFDSEGHFLFMFGLGVLAAGAEGTGDLTPGSKLITSITATDRTFLPEQEITGAGIPPETQITAVGVGTLTLSKPATATASGVAISVAEAAGNVANNERQTITPGSSPSGGSFTLTLTSATVDGTTAEGSNQVIATTDATGALRVGDATEVDSADGEGILTAGSPTVTSLTTSAGQFATGQPIKGSGIPAGTTIASVGAGTLTLSAPAVSSGAKIWLDATTTVAAIDSTTGSFTLSATSIDPSGNERIAATETTAPIPHNATVAEVAAALEVLPGIGAGNVALTGSAGGPWTVEFKGRLADTYVPQLTADAGRLTPSSATVTVSTPLQGHSSFEVCHAQCQPATPTAGPAPTEGPTYIAVDDSTGPSKGDVYISTGTFAPAGTIEKFDSSGQPIESWGDTTPNPNGQLTGSAVADPPAPIAGPFAEITGIAVDPAGNLWVDELYGKVFEFNPEGAFTGGWSHAAGRLALDSEDNVYVDELGNKVLRKYESTGKEIGQVAPSAAEVKSSGGSESVFHPRGLTVDPTSGELYLYGAEGKFGQVSLLKRYDSSCHPVITPEVPEPGCEPAETFGAGLISESPEGIAIDASSSAKPLYVTETDRVAVFALLTLPEVHTTRPLNPTRTSATLTGTVNPSGIELNAGTKGCRLEWGEAGKPYEHSEPCDKTAAQIGKGNAEVEVQANVTGLQAAKTYHYRLVASNANDENEFNHEPRFGEDLTIGPPVVENASPLEVTSTDAVLQAQVDPNNVATRVRVEYGREAGVYTRSTPETTLGAAGSEQTPTFELMGLEHGVTYHYRVVAESVLGEGVEAAIGPDEIFTTEPIGSFSLPDGRAWELVSTPDKHGAGIEPRGIQAAINGEAISYLANAPTEAVPQGNAVGQVQVLSTRSATAWASVDIATPHESPVGSLAGPGPEYKLFSPDLSSAIVEPVGGFVPSISAEASEKTPYLRSDFPAGDQAAGCTSSCYHPLVTGKAGFANVPAGTEFGQESSDCDGVFCGPQFLGASPDLAHVVLMAKASLTESAPEYSLYEWSAGQPQLISILPGVGGPAPEGVELGSGNDTRNAISTDGSRVVWSETKGGLHLYLRDLESQETLQLDRNKGGSGKGPVAPTFQDASSDDSVIFFTDTQQLTPGSGATENRPDLYRCQVVTGESGELECDLTDLTPANSSESANVQGFIPGASEDGSFVYFFANGVLAHNQVDNGAVAEEAKPADCGANDEKSICNLYVSHDGVTTFVAALSSTAARDWSPNLREQPTRVSRNGEWLEFMSQRPLTKYDSRDVVTGKPVAEVYLYSAAANLVVCPSCDPSGARPHGVEARQMGTEIGGIARVAWPENDLVAANVPGYNEMNEGVAGYQDRYLLDSGRLFFNATDGLVPQDSNGALDVYEYEPEGVGSCSSSKSTAAQVYSAQTDGCVGLISSGTSGRESAFLDASENGDDVFFLTAAQLSSRDTDSAYDVYDARVGGGETEPVKPVECQGDACQGFVEAPNDPTPGSLTFSGPGNLITPLAPPAKVTKKTVKCKEPKKLSHGKCVKQKRPRKAKRSAHKSAKGRK